MTEIQLLGWGEQLSRSSLDFKELLITLTQGLCKSSPTARACPAGRCEDDFSISLLGSHRHRGAGGERIHRGTSRAGGAAEASPGTAARSDEGEPAESPLRAARPLTAATGMQRSAGRKGTEVPHSCSGRTAVADPGPIPLTALPSTSAILNRPRPPAPQAFRFTIAVFPRRGFVASLPLPHTLLCSNLFSFYCCCYFGMAFLRFSTHIVQKFPRLHRVLPGHGGGVLTATFQPQGELLIYRGIPHAPSGTTSGKRRKKRSGVAPAAPRAGRCRVSFRGAAGHFVALTRARGRFPLISSSRRDGAAASGASLRPRAAPRTLRWVLLPADPAAFPYAL